MKVTPKEAAKRGWLINLQCPVCYVCHKRVKSEYVKWYPFVAGQTWYTHTGKCAAILDKSLSRLEKVVDEM